MRKVIALFIFAMFLFNGIRHLIQSRTEPVYKKMTIGDLDSLGADGLEYVEISEGWSAGSFIATQWGADNSVFEIKYPVVNWQNLRSPSDTTKFMTRLVVLDTKSDSVGFGPIDVKGKIVDALSIAERELIRESFILDSDFIVVKQGWEKPSPIFALIMILMGSVGLLINVRNYYPRLFTRGQNREAPGDAGDDYEDQLV